MVGAVALGAALVALLVSVAPAAADQVICAQGTGAGQCTDPSGVAGDRDAGLLYVADAGNQEVDVYDAESGAFVGDFEAGVSLGPIAVDNDPASEAHRDVYVLDTTNNRVLKLRPSGGSPPLEAVKDFGEGAFADQPKIAVGPGGIVHVADIPGGGNRRVQTFDHEGNPVETCSPLAPGEFGGNLQGFAVDSAGGFYLANAGGRPIERYDSSCAWLEESFHTSFNIQTLALDGEDDLFVADSTEAQTSIYAYDPTATLFKVLYGDGTLAGRPNSLAPLDERGEDLFAAEGQGERRVVRVSYPPPGPIVHPDPELTEADPVSATKATLASQVNPEGKASQFRFEYVDDAAYQEDLEAGGDGFAGAQSSTSEEVPTPESIPAFLAGSPLFALSPVSAQIGCTDPADPPQTECLKPQTLYHFRAVAGNADGESTGPEETFETKPPLRIDAVWSSEVGIDAAKLSAQATPFGVPLAGRFHYVEEAICLADVKAAEEAGAEDPAEHCFDRAEETAELDFGAGEDPVVRTAQLHSLKRGTAYRYRIVLENLFVPEGEPGEVLGFATYALAGPEPCPNDALRGGGAAKLPDCRAYEMVSPLDKEGGDITVGEALGETLIGHSAELNQAAAAVPAAGAGLTYSAARAFGDAVSAPFASQYIASRSPGDGDGELEGGEGWHSHGISPPREGISFLALGGLSAQFMAFSEDLRLSWLRGDSEPPLTAEAIAGHANLYRRENPTDAYAAICPVKPPDTSPLDYRPLSQGFSADGQRTIFRANDKLSEEAASTGAFQLYACEAGAAEPVVVSALPPARGGEASGGNSSLGTAVDDRRGHSLHNAVSADAQRVYWTDSGASRRGQGKIYLRERPFAEGEECAGPAPCTRAVSEAVGGEGSDAEAHFWTAAPDGSEAIFSFTAGALAGNLYRFDAEAEAEPIQPIAEGADGVAGWSEDATRVYFTSTEALAEGAVAGQRNLYLHEPGEEPRLVAGAVGEPGSVGFCRLDSHSPVLLRARRCTRATPDGGQLAFMSRAPLTGYDNADVASGEATAQVFLYDAEARGGEGELVCASCNPSGARPQSRAVAGSGSSQTPTAARLAGWQDAFHAPRALAADGQRLFFDSYDALLPADANGAADVYQWERAGKGGCEASDANYFPGNGGCIDLISSGEDRHDSRFLDASADGRDVFFKTSEGLWGPDPGLVDVYDARVLGGFPEPDPPRPPCEGEACQSPPAPPQQPAPASSLFTGPGDLAAPKPSCRRSARKARRFSRRAKRLRRAGRRAKAPARGRALRRRAKGAANRARRHSGQAKRCRRARARAARGARR